MQFIAELTDNLRGDGEWFQQLFAKNPLKRRALIKTALQMSEVQRVSFNLHAAIPAVFRTYRCGK